MLNLLICSSGSTPAQILAKNLDKDPRVSSIHLADMKRDIVTPHLLNGRRQQHFVQNSEHELYVPTMQHIIFSNNIDLVIPILPQDVIALNGSIPENMITTTTDSVTFCDKKLAEEALDKISIPRPKVWKWHRQHIDNDVAKFPLIAKPRSGMGGTGIEILKDAEDLLKFIKTKNVDDYIVQEYLYGIEEFTTDVVCDRDGRPMGMCTRKRIETKGGLCTVAETVETPDVVKYCIERICETYKFFGQINIQYLRDGGSFYFLEINPRPAGSAAISYIAGMNIAVMIIDAYLGIKRKYEEPEVGIKMMRYWNEVYDRRTV